MDRLFRNTIDQRGVTFECLVKGYDLGGNWCAGYTYIPFFIDVPVMVYHPNNKMTTMTIIIIFKW